MGVLRAELGLRVPEDVAVVGFDDVPMAAWPEYDLTTVRQRMGRLVAETVETLLARIEDSALPPSRRVVEGRLIVRGSTRPARPPGPPRLAALTRRPRRPLHLGVAREHVEALLGEVVQEVDEHPVLRELAVRLAVHVHDAHVRRARAAVIPR